MSGKNAIPGYLVCSLVLAGVVAGLGISHQTGHPTSAPESQPSPDKTDTAGTSCIFDFERGEVPDCLRQGPTGRLLVAPKLLKEMQFDSYGLASLYSRKDGWMYANRKGLVVVRGVALMDNGADSFHDGLVRVEKNSKYGFANRRGRLVIPAIYDGALNFENGKARVCKGCESKCADPPHDVCEHHFFAGGEWFEIDTKGNAVALQP